VRKTDERIAKLEKLADRPGTNSNKSKANMQFLEVVNRTGESFMTKNSPKASEQRRNSAVSFHRNKLAINVSNLNQSSKFKKGDIKRIASSQEKIDPITITGNAIERVSTG
jgi:hypothetical protein